MSSYNPLDKNRISGSSTTSSLSLASSSTSSTAWTSFSNSTSSSISSAYSPKLGQNQSLYIRQFRPEEQQAFQSSPKPGHSIPVPPIPEEASFYNNQTQFNLQTPTSIHVAPSRTSSPSPLGRYQDSFQNRTYSQFYTKQEAPSVSPQLQQMKFITKSHLNKKLPPLPPPLTDEDDLLNINTPHTLRRGRNSSSPQLRSSSTLQRSSNQGLISDFYPQSQKTDSYLQPTSRLASVNISPSNSEFFDINNNMYKLENFSSQNNNNINNYNNIYNKDKLHASLFSSSTSTLSPSSFPSITPLNISKHGESHTDSFTTRNPETTNSDLEFEPAYISSSDSEFQSESESDSDYERQQDKIQEAESLQHLLYKNNHETSKKQVLYNTEIPQKLLNSKNSIDKFKQNHTINTFYNNNNNNESFMEVENISKLENDTMDFSNLVSFFFFF